MPQPDHRTIYIVCPARYRTGGPEALDRLDRALLDPGHDAKRASFDGEPRRTRDGSAPHVPEIEGPTSPAHVHHRVRAPWTIGDDPADAALCRDGAIQITDRP